MADWIRVASVGDMPVGALKGIDANGVAIVLANVDGVICALHDRCSHEEYPLSDGELDGGDIVCAYHGARFDACTGARKALPAVLPVRSFPVDVRDGEIYVEVGE
jgi:3-phenylpropionate/trans-cinnamate dioxygenase ferredoxin component